MHLGFFFHSSPRQLCVIAKTVQVVHLCGPNLRCLHGYSVPIFKPSPITPTYNDYLIFEGISVDEYGKQHYLDVHVAYRQACLNAIEYLKKFGYSGVQVHSILGTAPVQGHISGVVDIPNACATLWLPTQIFEFDINPSAAGPTQFLDGSITMPLSPDK